MTPLRITSKSWFGRTRAKFGNKATDYRGVRYHSAREATFAAELDLLVRAGELDYWQRQQKVPLVVRGKLICTIVVDFVLHWHSGLVEWVEVKGAPPTADWQIKWKLFDALHPDYRKRVVK